MKTKTKSVASKQPVPTAAPALPQDGDVVSVRYAMQYSTWCVVDRSRTDGVLKPLIDLPIYLVDVKFDSQKVEDVKYVCGGPSVVNTEIGVATGTLRYDRPEIADKLVEENMKFVNGQFSCSLRQSLTDAKVVKLGESRYATVYRERAQVNKDLTEG